MKITIEVYIDDRLAEETINDVFLNIDLLRYIGYWAEHTGVRQGIHTYRAQDKSIVFGIDRALAIRFLREMVKAGVDLDNADADDYDQAVQRTLFGKVKYG